MVETVRIEKPELDVGLWQHLANRDLYKNLGRVREEGLFSGLLYPERAKFVVITSRRIRNAVPFSYLSWSRHFVDHSPLTDARRAAYWMGDTMFSWYYDREGPLARRFRTSLSSEFGNFMQSNGQQSRSIAGCQVDPTLVSYQGDDAREFRKFYQCKLGNAVGYGLFSGLRTQFNHVAAHYRKLFTVAINDKCAFIPCLGPAANQIMAILDKLNCRQAICQSANILQV